MRLRVLACRRGVEIDWQSLSQASSVEKCKVGENRRPVCHQRENDRGLRSPSLAIWHFLSSLLAFFIRDREREWSGDNLIDHLQFLLTEGKVLQRYDSLEHLLGR